MGVMMDRFRAIAACDPAIPDGYRRVKYIQSTSDAYVATGYSPARYDEIAVDYMIDGTSSMYCLLSAGTGSYQLIVLGYGGSGKEYYCRYFSSGGAETLNANTAIGVKYHMSINSSGVFSVNGESITKASDGTLDGDNTSLWIFRRRNGSYPFVGKLYGFTAKRNGAKVLELIPCVRNRDSVAGVYDTVSKTFYASAGTESFKAG